CPIYEDLAALSPCEEIRPEPPGPPVLFPRWKLDPETRRFRQSVPAIHYLLQCLVFNDMENNHVIGMEGSLFTANEEAELLKIHQECQRDREELHELERLGKLKDDQLRERKHAMLNAEEIRRENEVWDRFAERNDRSDAHEIGRTGEGPIRALSQH